MIDDATERYEAVVKLMPASTVHNNLGILYDSKNKPDNDRHANIRVSLEGIRAIVQSILASSNAPMAFTL
ncbi:MAG TPA: hypothetical protein VL087_02395 [Nitrospirota bacterium]|nr:hypothetical protein [Nitrospirota bacterium]